MDIIKECMRSCTLPSTADLKNAIDQIDGCISSFKSHAELALYVTKIGLREGTSDYFLNTIDFFEFCHGHSRVWKDEVSSRKIYRLVVEEAVTHPSPHAWKYIVTALRFFRHHLFSDSGEQPDFDEYSVEKIEDIQYPFTLLLNDGDVKNDDVNIKKCVKVYCNAFYLASALYGDTKLVCFYSIVAFVIQNIDWICLQDIEQYFSRNLFRYINECLSLVFDVSVKLWIKKDDVTRIKIARFLCHFLKNQFDFTCQRRKNHESVDTFRYWFRCTEQSPNCYQKFKYPRESLAHFAQWSLDNCFANLAFILGVLLGDWQLVVDSVGRPELSLSHSFMSCALPLAKVEAYFALRPILSLLDEEVNCHSPGR